MTRSLLAGLLLVSACRSGAPAAVIDAGVRKVTVKLGGPLAEISGDAWPKSGDGAPSEMHEIKGPLELTVLLPSGRRYTTQAERAIGTTNDARTHLRHIELRLNKTATWPEMVDSMDAPLAAVGVSDAFRKRGLDKLRQGRVEHPHFPAEGCASATATTVERFPGYELYLDLGVWPDLWHINEDWPDTCLPDGGVAR
jgi:hypothetical protein